ncbi:MAG: hypothetical protein WC756_17625 [Taibaiella sp.]|jgi:hypothetical protein
MATTTEYIIILVGFLSYGNTRIDRIRINKGYFTLFDANGTELYTTRRIGGTGAIVSGFIPYLSYGAILRYLVDENKLFSINDQHGPVEIECKMES